MLCDETKKNAFVCGVLCVFLCVPNSLFARIPRGHGEPVRQLVRHDALINMQLSIYTQNPRAVPTTKQCA